MTEHEALIALNMLPGVGALRLEALLGRFSKPSAILEASVDELESVNGIGSALADKIAEWKTLVPLGKELDLIEKGGVTVITKLDPEYPAILKEIYDPPICLYVRGVLPELNNASLAIVGSRRMTNYGRKCASHFAQSAAYADWTVVSGLAYGIDAAAHQACLDASGRTVAVLGSGLARVQPQDHLPLARAIIENGALVSEFPMEFSGNRQSFPRRNRIISGLSRAVLIVEAGLNSGALITAESASEQNRELFAVPGPIDQPQSQGCNRLIKDSKAKLAESFDDILTEFEYLPGMKQPELFEEDSGTDNVLSPNQAFSSDESKIINALSNGRLSLDEISAGTLLPVGKLLSLLMKLEMTKAITQEPGKIFSIRKHQA